MTTAKIAAPLPAPFSTDDIFPYFPPRDDLQNYLYLHKPSSTAALAYHFGDSDTTLVGSEIPVGWNPRQRAGILIPDLMVIFDIDHAATIARNGYAIPEHGKPPDFVLEIASPYTARNDVTGKRRGYAEYGVPEYWRFDHTGGRYYGTGLAGDRLENGAYTPMHIVRVDADRSWGHSPALGLFLCWEYGELRWYDPQQERYLPTYDEIMEARNAEQDARRQADARIQQADARIRELEAENRRLRGP